MSRNPYHVEGQPPKLRRSVFAFMDILAYSETMRRREREGTQQEELNRLHDALSSGRRWLEGATHRTRQRRLRA